MKAPAWGWIQAGAESRKSNRRFRYDESSKRWASCRGGASVSAPIAADNAFVTIPVWVLDSVSWGGVALYAVLQSYADGQTSIAYPSRQRLSERMDCSLVTVDKYLRELQEAGALRVWAHFKGETNERTSNRYLVITADPNRRAEAFQSDAESQRMVEITREAGSKAGFATPQSRLDHPPQAGLTTPAKLALQELDSRELEPGELDIPPRSAPEDPSLAPTVTGKPGDGDPDAGALLPAPASPPKKRGKASAYTPEFEAFWKVYPRKDDKRAAFRAWEKALARVGNPLTIIAGAERYAADPNREREFTKHAGTWLNADAWDNDPLPPRQSQQSYTQQRVQGTRQFLSRVLAEEEGQGPWSNHLER